MTRDEPTYLLFALPPGDESAFGISVGEADTLERCAEVLKDVPLKPGETGIAVRPGKNKPEAAWLRTQGGEMRRCSISKPVPAPNAGARRHETVAYSGDAADVLKDVLRSQLSPQALAVIAEHIAEQSEEGAVPSDEVVKEQVWWFQDRLRELVGGDEAQVRLAAEVGV